MEYTKIPTTLFQNLQMNAGILVDDFTPSTGVVGNIIGATNGGTNITDTPSFIDLGEGVDNAPTNVKQMKQIQSRDVHATGTFVSVTPDSAQTLVAGADVTTSNGVVKIVPRDKILLTDFKTIWFVGDYSDKNTGASAGFLAIKLMNVLNTGGFKMQTANKDKGSFAFDLQAHYDLNDISVVPYEIYIKAGTDGVTYGMTVESEAGTTTGYTAITTGASAGSGESYVYQTGTDMRVPDRGAVLNGSGWTAWNGSSEIASTTGLDIVVAIINSNSASVRAGKTTVTVKAEE